MILLSDILVTTGPKLNVALPTNHWWKCNFGRNQAVQYKSALPSSGSQLLLVFTNLLFPCLWTFTIRVEAVSIVTAWWVDTFHEISCMCGERHLRWRSTQLPSEQKDVSIKWDCVRREKWFFCGQKSKQAAGGGCFLQNGWESEPVLPTTKWDADKWMSGWQGG